MRVMITLAMANHRAGMRPDSHTCGRAHVRAAPGALGRCRQLPRTLPLAITPGEDEPLCWTLGLSALFARALVMHRLPAATIRVRCAARRCNVETVILPAHPGEAWDAVGMAGPFR